MMNFAAKLRLLVLSILCVVCLSGRLFAFAEGDTEKLVVTPQSLTIKAERGATIRKVVTLSSNSSIDIRNFTLRLSPLRTTAEYKNDLGAPKLTITPKDNSVDQGKPGEEGNSTISIGAGSKSVETLVTFTLNRDELQYGEFSSELVVFQKGKTAGDAETEVGRIPVNIKVRDSGPWPFVVLALGVAVGMFAGWYRLKGQARDQAQADVEQLDAFLEQPDVPEPFSDKVRELTVLARDALNKGELTKVSESVQQANGVVLQFNRARLAWLSVWKFCLDFRGALAEHKSIGTDTFGTKLATSLQTEFENIQGSFVESGSSPGKARQDLNPLLDKLNQYQQVCDDLRAFTKERELLTGAEADNWQQIYNQLSTRLGILGPADFGPNLGSLKAEIQAKLQELKSKTIAQAAAGEAAKESARAVPDNQWRQINHLAEYKSNWFRDRFDGVSGRFSLSRFRMRGYMLFGYAFPAMVFIYTGIQELYFKNAVFGTLDNYVGLFLSGFAADASGTKVQELIHQAGSRIEPREENKPADTPTPPKKP